MSLKKATNLNDLKLFDFRDAPKCPYGELKWNRYYWEMPQDEPQYESDYWGKTIDPDGKSRDMLSTEEWDKQVEDIKWIVDIINSSPEGKLIDVGCGPGYFLSAIDKKWEKHGVDVSAVALESAKKYAIVKQGEFPNLDYSSEYFDVAFMNHVIEHLNNPIKYVEEAHRILKKGGVFIIGTPDFDCGCARRFKSNYRMLHDKGHISLFTTVSLMKMLEDSNFRIIHIEYPFFDSIWYTTENLLKMKDTTKISPPFYGNHVVVFAEKV